MCTETETANACGIKNYLCAKDLLLDIKALAKEYYTMTFLVDGEKPETKIMFTNGQIFKLSICEISN